jgi:hypothetical protein
MLPPPACLRHYYADYRLTSTTRSGIIPKNEDTLMSANDLLMEGIAKVRRVSPERNVPVSVVRGAV